jgi:hypothetical protein
MPPKLNFVQDHKKERQKADHKKERQKAGCLETEGERG